jgi:hypothetical protein
VEWRQGLPALRPDIRVIGVVHGLNGSPSSRATGPEPKRKAHND